MKALITGGAGFIGSHLSEKLLAKGDKVMVIDDFSTGSMDNIAHLIDNPLFSFAQETVRNDAVMDRLASECDVIYHLAAAVGVKLIVHDAVRVIETNIMGTEAVLRVAHRYGKKVLLTSTSEVYGKQTNPSFSEDDDSILGSVTHHRWSYACSKMLDEFMALAYCRQRGLPVTVVRLFNTIGLRQTGYYGMVVPNFVRQALANEDITVYGDGMQSRCFCDARDVTEALISLVEKSATCGQIYNVGGTNELSILDLAKRVIELSGSSSKIVFVPYDKAYEAGFEDMRHRKPNTDKIRKLLGWEPRFTLDDTLRSIIDYERNRPR